MLDLGRQYMQIRDQVLTAVEHVCSSQHFILGAEVEALERELAAYCGLTDGVGCASGTDALWLALLAGGIQPDRENSGILRVDEWQPYRSPRLSPRLDPVRV